MQVRSWLGELDLVVEKILAISPLLVSTPVIVPLLFYEGEDYSVYSITLKLSWRIEQDPDFLQ